MTCFYFSPNGLKNGILTLTHIYHMHVKPKYHG